MSDIKYPEPKLKLPIYGYFAVNIRQLGGPTKVSKYLAKWGRPVTAATISRWMGRGSFPVEFYPIFRELWKINHEVLMKPELLDSFVEQKYQPRSPKTEREHPNEALNQWIRKQGGAYRMIAQFNAYVRDPEVNHKGLSQTIAYQWMAAGRVPEKYHNMLRLIFDDVPDEALGLITRRTK